MRRFIPFVTAVVITLTSTACNFNQLTDEDAVDSQLQDFHEGSEPEATTANDKDMEQTGNPLTERTEKMFNETHFLKTKGKTILTQKGKGQVIQLRGVNLGGYLLQEFWMTPTRPSTNVKAEIDVYEYLSETYGEERMMELINIYQDNYFTEEDFDKLAALGINLIRLPFWYRNIVDGNGAFLDGWHDRFDWFLEEAGKRGIYVMLDFHGAPGSQNGSDHSGVDGQDEKEAASLFFYGDETLVANNQALYLDIWETIALRYKDNPVVAGYDLLNEPYCTYRYNASVPVNELHSTLWDIYDQAYHRIRAVDPDHIIVMEATWDPSDLPDPKDYGWENVVYEYHNYHYGDYNNENNGQIQNMQKKINLIQRANYDVPSFMGEFSYFNNYDTWDHGLALLNENDIHWTMWTYKVTSNYGNWGLYHHTGGDINIESIDDKKLAVIWSKVGDSRPNQALIDVVKKHLN